LRSAPVISKSRVSRQGNTISITGVVQDASSQPVEVYFAGIPSAAGKLCFTNNDGSFSYSMTLTSADSGILSAEAINCYFLLSAIVSWGL
jgi:hypothetical protein